MKLRCGCERPFMDERGRATMKMFDGIQGLNCLCPEHGWTLQVTETWKSRFADKARKLIW